MIINNILNKPLVFRVDANNKIGAGHIMRCIALAQEWKFRGGDVVFLSCCDSDNIKKLIAEKGFKYIEVVNIFSEEEDIANTISVLNSLVLASWLVIDGYHFSSVFCQKIRGAGYKLLLFDDVNDRSDLHADIILNQNIDAENMKYNCNSSAIQLLGVGYALLRREFHNFRNTKRMISGRASKIVITMGGGDSGNVTLKIIQALNLMNDSELDVKIIAGPSNIHLDSLFTELNLSIFKNELMISVKNMPEIMAWADLAITAGGSTCWEFCFMGVPSLVVCTAPNQEHVVNGLNKRQIFKSLGWWEDLDTAKIAFEIQKLMIDTQKRLMMRKSGEKLIDGKGPEKLVNILSSF